MLSRVPDEYAPCTKGVHVAISDDQGRHTTTGVDSSAYEEIYDSPEFKELQRKFRRLVVPLVVGFLAWYFTYVLLAVYAHDFMSEDVVGNFNVGFFFGLGQFASTFGIAYVYAIRAEKDVDPLSAELLARFNARVAGGE
jgi:uncharacterized membrane protein (DUF485 family)